MTHHRPAGSLEAVLLKVLQVLPPVVVDHATGHKIGHFYRISNPTNGFTLALEDGAKLDAALLARGEQPRFASLMAELTESALARMGGARPNSFCIDQVLRRLTAELGDLARSIDLMADDGQHEANARRQVAKEAQDLITLATAIRDAMEPRRVGPPIARAAE